MSMVNTSEDIVDVTQGYCANTGEGIRSCMFNYCTLFDTGYLDRGLVLYESLLLLPDDFHLYIFAFDDATYSFFMNETKANITVISLKDFETPELLEVKQERTWAEYCWTCTPCIIEYVLEHFDVDMCTYVDADMQFLSSAKPIFDEMQRQNASIIITPHRFGEGARGEEAAHIYGTYCVEFNTFKNDKRGRVALSWWKARCLEWCSYKKDGEKLGDQKYLDAFPEKFEGVMVNDDIGAGIAPWNIKQYRLTQSKPEIRLHHLISGRDTSIIFYHFQNIRYIGKSLVNINSQTHDKDLKMAIYLPYLYKIKKMREMLINNYGIHVHASRAISSNLLIAWIQEHIMPFRVRIASDLVNINYIQEQTDGQI